jgi:hypothetical protein
VKRSSCFRFRAESSRAGNCRNLLPASRVQREAAAEGVEKQWRELLLHATIERDTEKMSRLVADLDQRKRRMEAVGKRSGNFLGI